MPSSTARTRCILASLILLLAAPASAAEVTRVLSSFDDENDQPFGFRIAPSFNQRIERGEINREGRCLEPTGACPAFLAELQAKRVVNSLDFDIGFGLYKDLELRVQLPIILSDRRTVELNAGRGVTRATSSVDPARAGQPVREGERFNYRLFPVGTGNEGPGRSGLGDMTFGLAWAAFSEERLAHVATVVLGFDYTAPTGTVARGDNEAVGRGVHELGFSVIASRRINFMDPYFGLSASLPLRDSAGLFENRGANQQVKGPGQSINFTTGSEIIMYRDEPSGQRYTFQLGLDFGYTFEGRDYSPLFDAFATNNPCNGIRLNATGLDRYDGRPYPPSDDILEAASRPECAWIVQQMANQQADGTFRHDGITNIEGHANIGGHLGFHLQFSDYVQLRLGTRLETRSAHFITGAYTGRTQGAGATVDLDPEAGERNHDYNPVIDGIGNRFRYTNIFNLAWHAGLAFRF